MKMKPDRYRYPTTRSPRPQRLPIIRVVILLILSVAVMGFLYKDKIKAFTEAYFPSKPETSPKQTAVPNTGPPAITIDVDGRSYTIKASEGSSEESSGVSPSSAVTFQELGLGKNSKFEILFDKVPESFSMIFYQNDNKVFSAQSPVILAEEFPGDGKYQGICEIDWGLSDYRGTATYRFTVIADFPAELRLSSTEINPGELLVLSADNLNADEPLKIETDLDFKPTPFQYGNKQIVLLPVSYYNKPDKVYQIKAMVGETAHSYAVKVKDKAFTTQYLTIDTKVAAETRNDKSAKEVEEIVNPLKPVSDPEPYWTGKFLMPVKNGRVTEADFGKSRYVNNSKTSYRHNGLDIGQDKGAPVMASNSGRVLLAKFLIGTGNTVIIEHGFGLKTWYYHMDELSVKTEDWVIQGDIIGKVGSTGFSTSPHLHFSASVNGVFINPITLINEGIPLLMRD